MADKNSRLNLIEAQQAKKEITANALFNAMSPAAFGGINDYTTAGLVVGIYGGTSGTVDVLNTTLTLTDNAINYVSFNASSNTFTVNTSAFEGVSCYIITTSNGAITDFKDRRPSALTASGGASLAFYQEKGTPTKSPKAEQNGNIAIGEGAYTNASGYALSIFTDTTQNFYGALGYRSISIGQECVASNTGSVAFGFSSQSLAQFALSFGRSNIIKGGADNSSIWGGMNNTINDYAQTSTIYGGTNNLIRGTNSSIYNSYYSTINTNYSTAINNQSSTCEADYTVMLNAIECTAIATAKYSIVSGFKGKANMPGSFVVGFNDKCQFQKIGLSLSTTDATPTNMNLFNGAQTLNNITLPDNSAAILKADLVGITNSGDTIALDAKILIKNISGTNTIVSSSVLFNSIASDTALSTASAQLVLNSGFNIQVTGVASTNITWSANVELSQVFI